MSENIKFIQGNEACVEGALYAGLDFFAGYPITPSTEIAELLSYRLPQKGGKFIQMEDEIASICAIIGASLTGHKVMTATSGPGFSLMQEALGYAIMAEIPCVIVNVQRGGPFYWYSHPREPGRRESGPMGNTRGSCHCCDYSFQPPGCISNHC